MTRKYKIMNNIMLFCFPHAGGTANSYIVWRNILKNNIILYPVELSGRGKRIGEPLYASFNEILEDTYNIVLRNINGLQFALWGHSMGAVIAFELAKKLRETRVAGLKHLFVSGMRAPHVLKEEEMYYHKMPEAEFTEYIKKLGGIPEGVFEHPELLREILNLTRNDLRIIEEYRNSCKDKPLNCDISVLIGREDVVNYSGAHEWYKYSSKSCSINYFDGGHFFINNEMESIAPIINNALLGSRDKQYL